MDERLAKALDFSNYMVTLGNQRRALEEKFLANCVHYQNGGSFTVSKDLITFIKLLIDSGDNSAVVLDDNNIPVRVDELAQFFSDIIRIYNTAINEYYNKYSKLKQNRSVESLIK